MWDFLWSVISWLPYILTLGVTYVVIVFMTSEDSAKEAGFGASLSVLDTSYKVKPGGCTDQHNLQAFRRSGKLNVLMTFIVYHTLRDDEKVVIVGENGALGEWDVTHGLILANRPRGSNQWVGVVRLPVGTTTLKAVVMPGGSVCWEDVQNRRLDLPTWTQQSLVTFDFNGQLHPIEITEDPGTDYMTEMPGQVSIKMPYWRHTLQADFIFCLKTDEDNQNHACLYLPREGATVVALDIPKDQKLTGHFRVKDNGQVKISDELSIYLPEKDGCYQVLWPFSALEDPEITEITFTKPDEDNISCGSETTGHLCNEDDHQMTPL